MAEETRTTEEILASWNKPPKDSGFDLVVGVAVPEGDTRATASVDHNNLSPDGDDGDEAEDYDSWLKADLQAEIDSRNEDRDDDDMIEPEGTLKEDLVAALEADDEEHGEVGDPNE